MKCPYMIKTGMLKIAAEMRLSKNVYLGNVSRSTKYKTPFTNVGKGVLKFMKKKTVIGAAIGAGVLSAGIYAANKSKDQDKTYAPVH